MDYLTIYAAKNEEIVLSVKGGGFLNNLIQNNLVNLFEKLKNHKIAYNITRLDYQATFITNSPEKTFKEFRKSETKLKKFIVESKNKTETIAFGNSVFKVMLYLKSLQLEQVKKKSFKSYKKAFVEKYGELKKDILRLEYSLTSKSVFLNKMKKEIEKTGIVRDITMDEINATSTKYKLTKKFQSSIRKAEVLK